MQNAPQLAKFQAQFGDYLRKQTHNREDETLVPQRVGQLYQELIYNSVANFPKQCFVICQAMLGDEFDALCREFFRQERLHSPYFPDINRDFVAFIEAKVEAGVLPAFFADLAHFEWIELAVDLLPDAAANAIFMHRARPIALNPTLQNLRYDYAVQAIDVETQPQEIYAEESYLVMYRNLDSVISTLQTNALTFLLIEFIQNAAKQLADDESGVQYASVSALLGEFLPSVGLQNSEQMAGFAEELIDDLLTQQVFLECL